MNATRSWFKATCEAAGSSSHPVMSGGDPKTDVADIAVNAGKKVALDVLAVDFLPGVYCDCCYIWLNGEA